ncbi:dephospho-CoA kinase [Fangia hongkongensis]|uniref:dephospho-CoA kinase n=1 Tax=Fangia hongkongensis TaxID=270495 RepID=UPI0003664420|nr:dephospho-CoA kinase [Fangia hongkongensis]MBK2125236.1 dephospho-CoA kinase [Fangia hongkongensis]
MYAVGLTGGIGSGKTTVAKLFYQYYQINTVSADLCAREVITRSNIISEISTHFGKEFVNREGQINRQMLRERIIQNPKDKSWLNALMHPIIRKMLVDQVAQSQSIYTLVDIPLLTLKALKDYPYLQKIITVTAKLEIKIARIMARDKQNHHQALSMIKAQIDDAEREKFSDFIIQNNHDEIELLRQIEPIHQKLVQLS